MGLCDDEPVETRFQKARLEHLEARHSLWSAAEAHEAWGAWGMSLMFISQITAQISLQPWIKENYQVKRPSTPNKTLQSNWRMSRSMKTSILFWVWFSRGKKHRKFIVFTFEIFFPEWCGAAVQHNPQPAGLEMPEQWEEQGLHVWCYKQHYQFGAALLPALQLREHILNTDGHVYRISLKFERIYVSPYALDSSGHICVSELSVCSNARWKFDVSTLHRCISRKYYSIKVFLQSNMPVSTRHLISSHNLQIVCFSHSHKCWMAE